MRNSFLPKSALFLLFAALVAGGCGESPEVKRPEPSRESEVRVALAGHLYSLYTRNRSEKEGAGIQTSEWIDLFAREMSSRELDAVFLLGDTTRFSDEKEWQLVDRSLQGIAAPLYRVAGNHDLRDPENFRKHGGLGNQVVVIKNCKFIILDCKCVLEEADLTFLDRALVSDDDIAHTFIVMHYLMINWNEAHPDQDPREPYPGVSNWNRDVVPRIAGKVSYVFSGDHNPGGPTRYVQQHDGHTINYVKSSFVFRRGMRDDITGEGLNTWLELVVDDAVVHVLPRALPIPVNDSWYQNFNVIEPWRLHEVPGAWAWAPREWTLEAEATTGRFVFSGPDGLIRLAGNRRPLPSGATWDSERMRRVEKLKEEHPQLQSLGGGDFMLWHVPARWDLVALDPGDPAARRFFASFAHEGLLWSFEGQGPPDPGSNAGNWSADMIRLVGGMKLRLR